MLSCAELCFSEVIVVIILRSTDSNDHYNNKRPNLGVTLRGFKVMTKMLCNYNCIFQASEMLPFNLTLLAFLPDHIFTSSHQQYIAQYKYRETSFTNFQQFSIYVLVIKVYIQLILGQNIQSNNTLINQR